MRTGVRHRPLRAARRCAGTAMAERLSGMGSSLHTRGACRRPASSGGKSAGRPRAVAGVHWMIGCRHPQVFAGTGAATGNTVHGSLGMAGEARSLAVGARTVVGAWRAVNAFRMAVSPVRTAHAVHACSGGIRCVNRGWRQCVKRVASGGNSVAEACDRAVQRCVPAVASTAHAWLGGSKNLLAAATGLASAPLPHISSTRRVGTFANIVKVLVFSPTCKPCCCCANVRH